ncbi:uncharacterized protein [Fopius arisanus]|uniref:FLYWCH-type domain-containing protein n=1 Tax=Fopius arisanus TaxID=64838 RepID=A0A9R1UA96_9HYME|nr:PREDICTED: uncharacterized protein LOC105272716 [Fopius arisanus]
MAARDSRITNRSLILIDGYRFRVKSKRLTTEYIQCCGCEGLICNVSGKINENGQWELSGDHHHPPPANEIKKDAFKDRLWRNVVTSQENIRHIYDSTAEEDLQSAILVPFASVQRSMARWRQQTRPPIPSTLFEYATLLNNDQWKRFRMYNGGTLTVRTAVIDNQTSVTVLCDPAFLASLQINELYIDATFKICPLTPKIHQLLTIMGQIDDVDSS